jgi:hypothetical protein
MDWIIRGKSIVDYSALYLMAAGNPPGLGLIFQVTWVRPGGRAQIAYYHGWFKQQGMWGWITLTSSWDRRYSRFATHSDL